MSDKCRLCSDTLEGVDLKFGICTPCWHEEREWDAKDAEEYGGIIGDYDPYDDGLLDDDGIDGDD